MDTEDGPSLMGRSDEHFWHLKRYNTVATRITAMYCAVSVRADRGSGQTGREEELREYSQDHGAGDQCGESVGILYSLTAENTGQDFSREIDPNVTLTEIKLKSIRMRLRSYFPATLSSIRYLSPSPSRWLRIHQVAARLALSQTSWDGSGREDIMAADSRQGSVMQGEG